MREMTLRAHAKLNLFLHVVGRRADGYHLLESLVVFADLADELTVTKADAFTLNVRGEFADLAGNVESNLVLKAARALQDYSGYSGAARMELVKNIPVGAGLGGGSADAAAALRGLNVLWALGLSDAELLALATKLGADVAMCLASRTLMARGIGDEIVPLKEALPAMFMVLVYPRSMVLSAQVYAALTLPETVPAWGETGDFWENIAGTENHLQPAAMAINPAVAEVIAALEALRPTPALVRMTGSGACCFALYPTEGQATHAAALLTRHHPQWWVRAVQVR